MRRIEKDWGYEEVLEENNDYVVKKLFMKAGHRCSKQYHEFKRETFYLVSGTMAFHTEDGIMVVSAGYYKTIEPYEIHRMGAITDIVYLESSTPFLEDVVRLEDDYNRIDV